MSRAKGNLAAGWVADYLRNWWPLAEARPNSRQGDDIENTPGFSWEVKTGTQWRDAWLSQARRNAHGQPWAVVYLPPGCGAANVSSAHAVVPLAMFMRLLEDADYTPRRPTQPPVSVTKGIWQGLGGQRHADR